jgi:hypothetical protein
MTKIAVRVHRFGLIVIIVNIIVGLDHNIMILSQQTLAIRFFGGGITYLVIHHSQYLLNVFLMLRFEPSQDSVSSSWPQLLRFGPLTSINTVFAREKLLLLMFQILDRLKMLLFGC